jgi:hypothetical protein
MIYSIHRHLPLFTLLSWLAPILALQARAEPVATIEPPGAAREADAALTLDVDGEQWSGDQWVRILRDRKDRPVAMQTAIVHYVPRAHRTDPDASPVSVDLIGAVHIGDRAYYRELNRRFRGYDALLYELVAPEGTVVAKGHVTSNSNPLSALQNMMKSVLQVEHQLERIDYTRPNFVHADMSPEEFLQSMKDRNEGFTQMFFRMLGQSIAQQSQQSVKGQSAELEIISALFAQDRPRRLKIAMARQFEAMESLLVGLSGPDGSTLITERNKRALSVLDRQLAAGKQKLGIFYGAGHLSDMHQRLWDRRRMVPAEITWIDAWDLRAK